MFTKVIPLSLLSSLSDCTVDINLSEFEYLADHLTPEECRKLVALLHYHTFDVPKQLAAAERKLPDDAPCLDLLLHWNSAAGEGKGSTHVEVSHRLNQIGREDLAKWLSKTVFHELSKGLEAALTVTENEETTTRTPVTITEPPKPEIQDEAPWMAIDSVLSILIVAGLVALIFGLIVICSIYIKKAVSKRKHYEKLSSEESNRNSSRKYVDTSEESEFVTSDSEN